MTRRSAWQEENARRCPCRGSDDYCACQNVPDHFKPKSLEDQLADAEARVEEIKRAIRNGPCAENGHDWQSTGGANAGCRGEGYCGCSVPVNVCAKCGDCDYGDNAEAKEIRDRCQEARSE